MDGFVVLQICLQCPHSSLRSASASLLGEVCQNFEFAQNYVLENKLMNTLLDMIENDSNEEVQIKALYAVSCIVRNSPLAEKEFLKNDGLSYIMKAIISEKEKLVTKSCFLLSNIIASNDDSLETIFSMGYVEQIATVLYSHKTNDTSREFCSKILYDMSVKMPKFLDECLRPELNLITHFESRLSEIKTNDQYLDEENVIKPFLELLKSREINSSDSAVQR